MTPLDHFSKYLDKSLQTHVLIQDLKGDRQLREQFKEDEASVLDRYELKPEERRAILDRDFKALYELGVHPYLLGQLSRLIHGTVEGAGSSEASVALVRSLTSED
jgi:protocatechuate 4,5-dioxygenase alpha chain